MTPSSPPITLGHVLDELRVTNPNRGYPISLGDSDVRALAGKPSGDISLGDLLGKSSQAPLTATGNNDYAYGQSSQTTSSYISCSPGVTVNGGAGQRSFAWSILSTTDTVELQYATSQYCTVRKSMPKLSNGSVTTYLRCVVSDSTGSVTVDNIVSQLEWESNA